MAVSQLETLECIAATLRPLLVVQVGSLQMHGTGTALGDPIEVNAALAALLPTSKGRGAAAAGD